MKLRYFVAIFAVMFVGCLFAYAGADSLKSDFLKVKSFLNADSVTMFDDVLKDGAVTKFSIEEKSFDGKIDYSVYYDGGDKYFLESDGNFDFTIALNEDCDELNIPYTLIRLFTDSSKWYKEYSEIVDSFTDILKNNVSERDFSSSTAYVKRDGVRKKCEYITLETKNNTKLVAALKSFFSSREFAEMIYRVYGYEYTTSQLAEYAEKAITTEKISLVFKRSVMDNVTFEESVSLNTGDNIYSVKINYELSDDAVYANIVATDLNKTLDFKLNFEKSKDNSQRLDIVSDAARIAIHESDDSVVLETKDKNVERTVKIASVDVYTPKDTVYDMSVPSEKRVMFTRLSEWLTGNADAAVLFRTYEVNLKPLNTNAQDLKIKFDN